MNSDDKFEIKGRSSTEIWDFENAFYWFSHPTRLNKMLAHYDLFQTILEIPGDIFELGVFKAVSLIRFATFRNMLENDYSRKIVGFDAFGKFPRNNLRLGADVKFVDNFKRLAEMVCRKMKYPKLYIIKDLRIYN